jgi:hypothetical protein
MSNYFFKMTEIPETYPKYDPNRLFREGDKVEVVKNKGRIGSSTLPVGIRATVVKDEDECDWVFLKADDCDKLDTIDAAYLKLVKPVEELEPYIVVDAHTHWDVADKNMKTVAMYSKGNHPHAKEAAEAECDRLNDKWRKEQE